MSLDQESLDRASWELQRHFGREGSIYGIKACEEIARIAIVAYGALAAAPEERATNADVLAQVEAALRKNPLIATFLDQSFWHANFVDIAIRYNGELRRYEADWIKDIWYIVRRRGLSATQMVRAEQSEPPMNNRPIE